VLAVARARSLALKDRSPPGRLILRHPALHSQRHQEIFCTGAGSTRAKLGAKRPVAAHVVEHGLPFGPSALRPRPRGVLRVLWGLATVAGTFDNNRYQPASFS
jgi:hypothetical protein